MSADEEDPAKAPVYVLTCPGCGATVRTHDPRVRYCFLCADRFPARRRGPAQ